MTDAEEQAYVWDANLYTFVPTKGKGKGKGGWQTKGGGKSGGWQSKGGGKGKGYGSPGGDWEREEKATSSREPQGVRLRFSMEIVITAIPGRSPGVDCRRRYRSGESDLRTSNGSVG